MSRRAQENIVAILILGIFLAVIVASLQYGPRARMVPLPIASLGVLLCIAQLVWQNLRPAAELQVDVLEFLTRRQQKSESEAEAAVETEDRWGREALALALVGLLIALFVLIGPMPAIFLFTAGYMVAKRQYRWPIGVAFAAVFTAAVYGLFAGLLGVQVDRSVLGPMLGL